MWGGARWVQDTESRVGDRLLQTGCSGRPLGLTLVQGQEGGEGGPAFGPQLSLGRRESGSGPEARAGSQRQGGEGRGRGGGPRRVWSACKPSDDLL